MDFAAARPPSKPAPHPPDRAFQVGVKVGMIMMMVMRKKMMML